MITEKIFFKQITSFRIIIIYLLLYHRNTCLSTSFSAAGKNASTTSGSKCVSDPSRIIAILFPAALRFCICVWRSRRRKRPRQLLFSRKEEFPPPYSAWITFVVPIFAIIIKKIYKNKIIYFIFHIFGECQQFFVNDIEKSNKFEYCSVLFYRKL